MDRGQKTGALSAAAKPLTLDQVPTMEADRLSTGMEELDRVLGGGLVPGSATLLAGEPGIGKSTLLMQAAAGLAARQRRLLYVSGEESPAQLRLRAGRLGLDPSLLLVAAETSVEAILAMADQWAASWALLAIDSIQCLSTRQAPSGPGSLVQIRESAGRLMTLAKTMNRPLWLVGHVTKDGAIAGPKVL
ncbi:MAG: AAA family ATPase, partial [Deltaproteobacteria bacterium]|nr:AAA family ATPase [Deltaproteobacteria bacterium]